MMMMMMMMQRRRRGDTAFDDHHTSGGVDMVTVVTVSMCSYINEKVEVSMSGESDHHHQQVFHAPEGNMRRAKIKDLITRVNDD